MFATSALKSLRSKLFGKNARRPAERPRHRLAVERLENRELMAANLTASFAKGVLTVEGTKNNDIILVGQDNGYITVETYKSSSGPSTVEYKGGLVIESSSVSFTKTALNIFTGYKYSSGSSGGIGWSSWDPTYAKSVRATDVTKIVVYGLEGHDTIRLDDGAQTITAPAVVYGYTGNDYIVGGGGADVLNGWYGNDSIYGGGGDDVLYGGYDHDRLSGNAGRDKLYGYTGNDTLYGVFGEDYVVDAGAGNDSLSMTFNLDTFRATRGYVTALGVNRYTGTDTFTVSMDLGATGKELISTFIGQVKQFTGRLQPIVNLLNTRLALPGGASTPSLAQLLGGNYKAIADAIGDLNSFDVSAFRSGSFTLGSFQVSATGIRQLSGSQSLQSQPFARALANLDSRFFDVSFLTDATKAFKVAVGYNVDLFKFNLGSFTVNGARLSRDFGPFMIGVVPVTLRLTGAINLKAGGSIAYDLTGIRENNLIRGLRLDRAYASLSAPVKLEARAGIEVVSLGGGGQVTGSFTVSTGSVRLGSRDNVLNKVNTSGGLHYRLYVYAEYYTTEMVEKVKKVKDWKSAWEWVWKTVTFEEPVLTKRRAEQNIYNGYLPL